MLEQMMIGYGRALKGPAASRAIESDKPEYVRVVMRRATSRTWKHLARERLRDLKPKIPRNALLATLQARKCGNQENVRT